MKQLLCIILLFSVMTPKIIFDFTKTADIKAWSIVNDGVMGGKSQGTFGLDDNGHGVFQGHISLKNNGGFSSVRYQFEQMTVTPYTTAVLTLKGDGKTYQFRIKTKSSDYYSYIAEFETSGKWETIEIPLKGMNASFRGAPVSKPNFPAEVMEEITFLAGNKKNEDFKLLLDKIELK